MANRIVRILVFKSHNIVEARNRNHSMYLPDTGAVVVAVIVGLMVVVAVFSN